MQFKILLQYLGDLRGCMFKTLLCKPNGIQSMPYFVCSSSYIVRRKVQRTVYALYNVQYKLILLQYCEIKVSQICMPYCVCSSSYSTNSSSSNILKLSCEVKISLLCMQYFVCSSWYSTNSSFSNLVSMQYCVCS